MLGWKVKYSLIKREFLITKTMTAFYLWLNIYLLFKLIFDNRRIYVIEMNKMCYF